MVNNIVIARSFSTVTCGLLLGSTVWAGLAVMPSIIQADTTTHAKLAVFDGLITKAGATLAPIYVTAIGSLSYLAYHAHGNVKTAYTIAASSLGTALALQALILPKNRQIQQSIPAQKGVVDDGSRGAQMIQEVLALNVGRIIFSAVALGAVIYATEYHAPIAKQVVDNVMALKRPEYGLE